MLQTKVDLRKHSKQEFTICENSANEPGNLQIAAILRIADSLEIITQEKEVLIKRADTFKKMYQDQWELRKLSENKLRSKIRELQKELRIIKKNK